MVYHTQITVLSYYGGANPYPLFEFGLYGVDLFFVISGFIIVFIGSNKETTAGVFARKRIERVVPMYWLMTIGMFALTHIPGLARNEVSDPVHLVQSLLFFSWVNGPETYPVLNVGWTLEYEMLFYVVVAAAMALTRRPWITAATAILLLVLSGRGTSFFLQNPILIEFVFGMTIGTFLYDRRSFPWLLGAIVLVLLTLPMGGEAWRVWAFGLPATALVAGAIALDMRRGHAGRILPELGNASYSIYLVHVIAISFVCKIASVAAPQMATAALVPLIALFAIGVGYATYRLIERNVMIALARRRRA